MSNKDEQKTQAATDRIKAAALSAAKGLSRAQAERAAANAARNVNAYGQKEEGPSRWQERKEQKRRMYLMSTEKAVRLGERKDLKATSTAATSAQCQKCFQSGHWTYECKNERVYISRPSRSQVLNNPRVKMTFSVSFEGNPDVEKVKSVKEEKGKVKNKKKSKSKSKRKHRSGSDSDRDDSEASVFDTDSESEVTASDDSSESSLSYSSSDSEERRRRRKKQKRRRHRKRYSSSESSESSESESDSDSEVDEKVSRKKGKRHSRRR